MENQYIYCIGVMSGTSLDGIDFVYVKFNTANYQQFSILASDTVSYSKQWKTDLQNAISFNSDKLSELDITYGKLLGQEINKFISQHNIDRIDFIASHGHTVLHQPENGITLQIGNGQEIANSTNQKVICDFRTQDVKLGGQGAPLVPIGDKLLFNEYDYCLNLGGFANISFDENDKRLAYDVCPVNIVLNHYVNKLDLAYDDRGEIAASSKCDKSMFDALNNLSYYAEKFPKSLGLEWVQANIFPLIDAYHEEVPVVLHTFVKHVAHQLALNFKEHSSILVTGGGAYNTFLINELKKQKKLTIKILENTLTEFKEALIFGFLGLLRLNNQINVLSSVTGAKKDHSSGVIFDPQ